MRRRIKSTHIAESVRAAIGYGAPSASCRTSGSALVAIVESRHDSRPGAPCLMIASRSGRGLLDCNCAAIGRKLSCIASGLHHNGVK